MSLAGMIMLALIFETPWRVITLLLIILAACTILPRPARKWSWLSGGVLILVLILYVFLPDRGEWKPYRHNFERELAALNDKYAISDEENAAVIYNGLLKNYESGDFIPSLTDPNTYNLAVSQPWLSTDHPDLAQWLEGHESTITTLLEASKIQKCLFQQIDEDSLGGAFGPPGRPHLKMMMRFARLLVCAANNDLAEKKSEEALEKQFALLRMSEHLRQQPITVDMLAGTDFQTFILDRIKRILVTSNPTEHHLSKVEDTLAGIKHDWKTDWARIAEFEKLSVMKDLLWMLYETDTHGRTRLVVADFFNDFRPISQGGVPYWNTRRAKAESILTWFVFPHTPKKAAKIIDETLQKYGTIEDRNRQRRQGSRMFTTAPLRFNFSYVIDLYVESHAYWIYERFVRLKSNTKASGIIIALRRYKNKHGHWPKGLDEVKELAAAEVFVDPLNDGSFVYKLTEENFALYSKGMNNVDEGGRYDIDSGPDDCPIWPR